MAPPFDPGKDPRAGEQWIYRGALNDLFTRNGFTYDECQVHKEPGPDNHGRPKRDCERCWKQAMDDAIELKEDLSLPKLRELQKALEHFKFHKAGVYIVEHNCKCHFCLRLKHMPDDLSDFALEMALRTREAAEEEEKMRSEYKGTPSATESYDQYYWDDYSREISPEHTSLDDFYDDLDNPADYRTSPKKEERTDEIPPPPFTLWQRVINWFKT